MHKENQLVIMADILENSKEQQTPKSHGHVESIVYNFDNLITCNKLAQT